MKMNQQGDRTKMKIAGVHRMGLMVCIAALAILAFAASAQAATGPLFDIKAGWGDTHLPPGGDALFFLQARNIGDAVAEEDLTITDKLPAGVKITKIEWPESNIEDNALGSACTGVGTSDLSCTLPAAKVAVLAKPPGLGIPFSNVALLTPSGYLPRIYVDVEVDPAAAGTVDNEATISGGGMEACGGTNPPCPSDADPVTFSGSPAPFGGVPGSFLGDLFDGVYPFGEPSRTAGDHPSELRVNLDLNEESGINETISNEFLHARYTNPHDPVKDIEVTLPPGLIGNPEALPKCDPVDFNTATTYSSTACPANTQVGYVTLDYSSGAGNRGQGAFTPDVGVGNLSRIAIYNLEPPKGTPVDLGVSAGQGIVLAHIYATLDPAQNYAIKTVVPNITSFVGLRSFQATFWGVPGDPVHDKFRYSPEFQELLLPDFTLKFAGAPWGSAPIRPFFTNSMDCGFDNGGARIRIDSYAEPGSFTPVEEYGKADDVKGCDDPRFRFEPEISLQPSDRRAGAPTGLEVNLKIPQRNDEVANASDLYAKNGFVKGIGTPPLKKAVVTFPKGMTVNPSSAQGLSSCAPDQIGMGTDSPVRCPDASQFGTLTVGTPLLPREEPLEGFVYVAKPFDNPAHNFLSLYLVIEEPERGILAKLTGRADLDPQTGQITFTFDDLPQFPLEESRLSIKSGLRAGLVNPQTCGRKTIEADLYTWQDPQTPHHVVSHYDITQNPDGSPCHQNLSERPFSPNLSGGTVNNAAGSFSPLEITLSRSDEDQELLGVEGTAPPGLLASIKGMGRCSDAAIAAAGNPERTGTEEIEHPSCPADTLVGTVDAGSGVGQVLTYVPGKVYLAGPYKGAPLSGVAIVPAVAGPFDLGTVVTRAPAYINPQTAQLTVKTDPLPQIFKGVPIRVRDIKVHLNRSHFTLNPTNCEPFALSGTMFSTEGKSMNGGSRFQAADCASLGYKPKLTTRLFGGTTRGSHPKFKATYQGREGDANTASVVATLPRSEFLDQSHIRTVCTRVQFAAGGGNGAGCPAASIYGHAEARTPLLDETLQGPIYLRSSNHKLPDLVAALHGIVNVEVDGRIDSIKGGIRANFESVPDVPVESFKIAMQGGKKGLLVNSRNICANTYKINAEFKAQNGKEATLRPKLEAKCSHKRRAKHR